MTSIALVETIFLFVSVNSVSSSSDFEATTAALPMPLRRSDILEVLWPPYISWMRAHVVFALSPGHHGGRTKWLSLEIVVPTANPHCQV